MGPHLCQSTLSRSIILLLSNYESMMRLGKYFRDVILVSLKIRSNLIIPDKCLCKFGKHSTNKSTNIKLRRQDTQLVECLGPLTRRHRKLTSLRRP